MSISRKTDPLHVSRSLGNSGHVNVGERLLYRKFGVLKSRSKKEFAECSTIGDTRDFSARFCK